VMSAVAAGAEATIRIGAWNIEWLGNPGNRSGIARDVPQSPEDIAAYIRIANVSILSLEEIGDDDDSNETLTNSILDSAFRILNQGGLADWTYIVFPKTDPTSRDQHIALAWDRRKATIVGNPIRIPVNIEDLEYQLWDRTPYAVKLSLGESRTDLVFVPLHMKSNVGGTTHARDQRAREAERMVEVLEVLYSHFSDQDVVLLGDTNILNSREPAARSLRRAGYNDLNEDDQPTTFHGDAPFDRIFTRGGQPEFVSAAQEVIVNDSLSSEDHKRRLSDHYMVVSAVQVLADDDGIDHPVPFVGPIGGRIRFTESVRELNVSRKRAELVELEADGAKAEVERLRKRNKELEAILLQLRSTINGEGDK